MMDNILTVNTYNLDLNKIGPFAICYIDDEQLKHQKLKILFNIVLPEMGLSEDDVKTYQISKELVDILPINSKSSLQQIGESVDKIRSYMDKIHDEKMTVLKMREEFNYSDIDLTDNEIIELHDFIKNFK